MTYRNYRDTELFKTRMCFCLFLNEMQYVFTINKAYLEMIVYFYLIIYIFYLKWTSFYNMLKLESWQNLGLKWSSEIQPSGQNMTTLKLNGGSVVLSSLKNLKGWGLSHFCDHLVPLSYISSWNFTHLNIWPKTMSILFCSSDGSPYLALKNCCG